MTDEERSIMSDGNLNLINTLHISQESTIMMNATIVENINKMVGLKDQLFILGDFCWTRRSVEIWKRCREQLKSENIVLLWGNHDCNRDRSQISQFFTNTADTLSVNLCNKNYFLSHYAHAIWPQKHYGCRHLYGHSHGNAEQWLDSIMPGRLSMDVGVDAAFQLFGEYRPFSLDEIENVMSKR